MQAKENIMGTQKIPSLLITMSVPIIISMLVQALYNIVDSIFVAKFDNVAGTGALTIAFPIQKPYDCGFGRTCRRYERASFALTRAEEFR